jgi:alkanesulfonate monooxygenase SsuD/methylene tetrahydromethanopterin reductase-like flavin-dependent oxidoreductase (luciferase family)
MHYGLIIPEGDPRTVSELARETVTLDHLSGGRFVLPVGLGALDDGGFSKAGEPTDR